VGDEETRRPAFSRVYFEFPFGDLAEQASVELDRAPNVRPIQGGTNGIASSSDAPRRLFAFKRYGQARVAFLAVHAAAQGDERRSVALRLAECLYFFEGRCARLARPSIPFLDKSPRQAEALYFYALTVRALSSESDYLRAIRRVIEEFPDQRWAETRSTISRTHYIMKSDDDKADEVFSRAVRKVPDRPLRPSARPGSSDGARSGPSILKTRSACSIARRRLSAVGLSSGMAVLVRARVRGAERARACRRENTTWSPRLFEQLLRPARAGAAHGRAPDRRLVVDMPSPPILPGNEDIIRALLGVALYDQAIDEIHYAQKEWGDSSSLEATLAWIYSGRAKPRRASASSRSTGAPSHDEACVSPVHGRGRRGPAAGAPEGDLPARLLGSDSQARAEHDLDPYVVAGARGAGVDICPDIRSYAKAVGLMQLMPATGGRTGEGSESRVLVEAAHQP